ncbi:MAG: T9SS type A sorting domain-containing protein [Chitinophagales bacterium]|nr:T9SS type A sorting domain-containing protein [Chitinophagaceae bacterium]MCB9063773.1 T9SS type A sorting domain-containing protein [Chitinophagales bacterium]
MKQIRSTLLAALMIMGSLGNAWGQCATPTNLQTNYSNNISTFSWNSVNGATAYVIEMKQFWAPWVLAEVMDTITTNSYSLTGIMHSLTIDWRVKTLCGTGVSAYDSASYTVPCPQPTGPNTSNVTMTGATLSWTAPAGYNTFVSDFVVAYRPYGSNTWISLGHTSTNTMNVTGLQASTTYEWCVNQTCPYFISAPLIATFTTAGCTSAGNNSTEWISHFKLGSINRNSGAENGGYVQTNNSTNLSAGSNRNRTEIAVGNNGSFSKKAFEIFIDYNDNGVYESNESIYSGTIKNTKTMKFSISIPSNAPSGSHGMRVIMARNGTNISGCISGFNGETEDYTVNITGGSNKPTALPTVVEEAEALVLYPNPVGDKLNITVPTGVTVLTVYDVMGKQIHQQYVADKQVQINVSDWPATQYILQAIYENGRKEIKRFAKF